MTNDKAGKEYWETSWRNFPLPRAVDYSKSGPRSYAHRRFHQYFKSVFGAFGGKPVKLLEIGCGRSVWLPYFARTFGFEVYGIDYSESGCEQSRQILARDGAAGTIVLGDFFCPPVDMIGAFDIVVSFGVVEHFTPTSSCIAACARFLKDGGLLITVIPNMSGLLGWIQKIINRPVYDIHVPLNRQMLHQAHACTGLRVLSCEYEMFTNFAVCNLNGISADSRSYWIRRFSLLGLRAVSAGIWVLEDQVGTLPSNSVISPYINCLARKVPSGR
jgi:SAM-dependent methyltransferase